MVSGDIGHLLDYLYRARTALERRIMIWPVLSGEQQRNEPPGLRGAKEVLRVLDRAIEKWEGKNGSATH